MDDPTPRAPQASPIPQSPAQPEPAARPSAWAEWRDTAKFLLKLAIIVAIVRSFLFSPFNIPSESMMPRLLIGDYLFITKWNYGYSRYSLPFGVPLLPHVKFADPTPGDVVVFKAPPKNRDDWIKRVIGLPGDTIRMSDGHLILNGKPVPKQRIADFTLPISPNFDASRCKPDFQGTDAKGAAVCRIPRFRETLPNGRSYDVLDQGYSPADDTYVYTVPAGHVFLMGDNRDNSTDSRFSHEAGGISFVPIENIEGRAAISFWSTDGSAAWLLPWTWVTAARWSRIGHGY